jgi:hypothetical protein
MAFEDDPQPELDPAPEEPQQPQQPQQPQGPQGPSSPPGFRDWLIGPGGDQLAQQAQERLRTNYNLALQRDPKIAGQAQQIAAKLGIDPGAVQDNLDVAHEMVRQRAFDEHQVLSRYPVVARMFQNIHFATVAQDDLDNLQGTEGFFKKLSQDFEAGRRGNQIGYLGAKMIAGLATDEDKDRAAWMQERLQQLGPASGFLGKGIEILGGMVDPVLAALAGGGTAAGLASLGGPITASAAGTWGAAAGFFSQGGIVAAGNLFIHLKDQGYPEDVARKAAIAGGLVDGALMVVGGKLLTKVTGPLTEPIRQEIARAFAGGIAEGLAKPTTSKGALEFAKAYAAGHGMDVVMTLQRGVDIAAEELARKYSGKPDQLQSVVSRGEVMQELSRTFVDALQGMTLLALPGPLAGFLRDRGRAVDAVRAGDALRDQGKAWTESKTRANNPDAHKEFVGAAAAGTPGENLYFGGQEFLQSMRDAKVTPEDLAKHLPEVAKQLDDAAASGGDVVVPTEAFARRLSGTPLGDLLYQHGRFDPDKPSQAEGQQFHENLDAMQKEASKILQEQSAQQDAFVKSAQSIEKQMQRQLADTKTMPERDARAGAVLYRDFVVTQAKGLGITPEQLHARFPLEVKAAKTPPAEGEVLNQPSRGSYDPRRFVALLYEKADASTFLHEAAHHFLTVYGHLADDPKAPESTRADMGKLLESFQVKDLETWRSMSLDEQRRHHEAFASNFEHYLFEGKAPSVALQPWFDRFRQWLGRVYRSIRDELNALYRRDFKQDLPVLTPEVRGVMDRMLAAEDAIGEAEQVRRLVPLFQTREEAGMTEEQWQQYQEQHDEARAAAVSELTTASLRQMKWLTNARSGLLKAMQREAKSVREQVRKQVEQEVRRDPVRRAQVFLEKGEATDVDGSTSGHVAGDGHKLSREAVEAIFPKGSPERERLGRMRVLADEGGHPDAVAAALGFGSGEEMLRAILAAPKLEDLVEARTDEKMLAEHSELADPKARDRAIEKALHDEARGRFIAAELRLASRAKEPAKLMIRAARQAAKEILSRKAVKEIRPDLFSAAESRAANLAAFAMRKGDSAGVVDAKRKQLVQHELVRQAVAADEEVDRAVAQFDRMWRPVDELAKTRDVDLAKAAQAVLSLYGLGSKDGREMAYLDYVRQYDPALYEDLQPLLIEAGLGSKDYKDLTLEQFREMRDVVGALWFRSKRDREVEIAGKKIQRGHVVAELTQQIERRGVPDVVPGEVQAPTRGERAGFKVMNLKASLRRVESWALAMDGGQQGGPFMRYISRPIHEALDRYRADKEKLVKGIHDDVEQLDLPRAMIAAPELGYTFGRENGGIGKAELLGALRHRGNESNFRKLLLGRGWGDVRKDGSLDSTRWQQFEERMFREGKITTGDVDFLQREWDRNEALKPLAQKAHRELQGRYFDEVPATPWVTPFGTKRGGYVPAKTDPRLVPEARQHALMDDLEADFRQQQPSTGKGFTVSRVEYNRPLDLDVRNAVSHVDSVLRFVHVQRAIKDVLSVIRDREFAGVLNRVDPSAVTDMLIPWLNRSARQVMSERGPVQIVDAFWRFVRRNAGAAIMFASPVNALQQLTGVSNAATMVPGRHLKAAGWKYLNSPSEAAEQVASWSPYMEERLNSQVGVLAQDMHEMLIGGGLFNRAQAWSTKHAYFLQRAVQNQVDIVSWLGAYAHGSEEAPLHLSGAEIHQEAVQRANEVVRLTQGSHAAEDAAAYEVGTPFHRTWVQFTGYMNTVLNQLLSAQGWGQRAKVAILAFAVPTLISEAIATTLWGGWDDKDQDGYFDDVAKWFFGSLGKGAAGLVPGWGPATLAAVRAVSGEPGAEDRISTNPSLEALTGAIRAGRDVFAVPFGDQEIHGRQIRDFATLVSLATGIPISPFAKAAAYQVDVDRGTVQPEGTVDYLRGLLTGRAAPGTKR